MSNDKDDARLATASAGDSPSDPRAQESGGLRHTPGPWAVYVESNRDITVRAVAHPMLTVACVIGGLDGIFDGGIMGPTSTVNAHIIAAAPDLLEALKELDAIPRFVSEPYIEIPLKEWRELMDKVDAALAKAEGRS